MKTILNFLIFLVGTSISSGQELIVNGVIDTDEIQKRVEKASKTDNSLASYVCGAYYGSIAATDQMAYFEAKIMQILELDESHPDRKKIVGKFLNDNHDKLICGADNSNRIRDKEHLVKRAIGIGEYGFIKSLMYYEEEYAFDLNQYEIVDGEKETILDYIEKILNDPELRSRYVAGKLEVLHNDFIEDEAKRGKDL